MATYLDISSAVEEPDKCTIHYMPCHIDFDGKASVDEYFNSSIRNTEENVKTASFRGRPLKGEVLQVPAGYTGLVAKETRKAIIEEDDRHLAVTQTFKDFNFWLLDKTPSPDDKMKQAMEWLHLSNVLHSPVNSESSQSESSQQSVVGK